MCKKLALLIPLVLLVGPAQAATLFHWQFDGPAAQEIVSDTDIASSIVATRFTDDDGARDATGLTYGPSNPWYNETGTCADFQNDANGNDYGYGFFVPDGGVGSTVDLSTLSALTIEAYVHPYQFRQAVIVRKYSGGGYDGVYFIDTRPGGQFAVRLGGPNGDIGDAGGVCNDLAYDINEWYHVALVWDGTVVKCYVDGVQSQDLGPAGLSEIPFTGPIGDSDRALGIGCIIRGPMTDAGSPPSTGQMYHGRIDEVRISDTALSPSQFIFPLAGKKASRPGPATRAESICPDNLVLHWTPGDDAGLTNGHDVYFGTDSDNVKNADTATVGIYKGRQDSNSYPESGALIVDLGVTYYWRVDEVNETGTPDDIWPGSVWSFTVEDGNARDLDPPDGRRGVSPDVVLSWTPSCIAASHNVYLGTSLTDVTNGTGGTFKGSRTDPNYDPGGLDTFTTYYWRVDEVTSRGTFAGDVLTFRTGLGGLLMHFKFDGPLGNDLPEPITDFTGNVTFDHHYDPCDPGSMTYDEPNPFMNTGTSALFVPETGLYRLDPGPNTTDYVDILRLDGYQYTIEMWMRPYSFPDYDNNVLIKKYTPWSIEIDGGSQEIRFYHDGDDIESDDPTQAGEWYHVAAVFDQTDEDESQRLYINGVLNDDDDPTETNPADNNGPVAIGVMRRPSGSFDDYFHGLIDELAILDIALAPGEFLFLPGPEAASDPDPYDGQRRVDPNVVLSWIPGMGADSHNVYLGADFNDVRDATTLFDPNSVLLGNVDVNHYPVSGNLELELGTTYYWRVDEVDDSTVWRGMIWRFRTQSPIVDPNLRVWYKLDETEGDAIRDSSGREFDSYEGSASGNWDPNGGRWDGALICNDNIGFDLDNEVLQTISDGITVSVWLKDAFRADYDNWVYDAGFGEGSATYRIQAAVVMDPERDVYWRAGNDSNDVLRWDLDGANPANLEGWHLWVFVKNELAGQEAISIYFDGELVESDPNVNSTLANIADAPSTVGAVTWHSADFVGEIDDFRLYDKALSAAEIIELFRGGEVELAWGPSPYDGQSDVPRDAELIWRPGDYASSHDVYFGTDWDDVNDADTLSSAFEGNYEPNEYDPPGDLALNTTYYWRIDEVNGPNTWKGNVWRFNVADFLIVDDMESYNAVSGSGNEIFDTWDDGFTNWTGSQLALEYGSNATLHGGAQSMKLQYNNAIAYYKYSEIDANTTGPVPGNLTIGNDWTAAGVKALTLFFYGNADNDANEQLYAALGDGSHIVVVEYGSQGEDMNDVRKAEWRQWDVPLSDFGDGGVTLTNVTKVRIGFGDRDNPVAGGSGEVFLDDIRLYLPKCVPWLAKPQADFSNDCVVDFVDVAIMAEEWLRTDKEFDSYTDPGAANLVGHWALDGDATDASAYANHGSAEGDYSWVDGHIGSGALQLEGNGSRVLIPDAPQLRPTAQVTLTAWVNYAQTHSYSARVVAKGADADDRESYALQIDDENRLSFFIRDVNTTMHDVDSNDTLRHNEWIHLAGSYDGSEVKCYINGEPDNSNAAAGFTILVDAHDLAIGNRADATNRAFIGTEDDVRVYNRALSNAEVAYIATQGSGLFPLTSQANVYDKEPADQQAVNFRDYAVLMESWLEEILYPQ